MSDDVARGTTRPDAGPDPGRHGNAGPADPHADPVTEPALRPPEQPTEPVRTKPTPVRPKVGRTRLGGLWAGLILSALVLILLLIFILQNGNPVSITFLGWTGTLPTGVALLLAAVAGLLLVAIPGTGRILQLRRAARRGVR